MTITAFNRTFTDDEWLDLTESVTIAASLIERNVQQVPICVGCDEVPADGDRLRSCDTCFSVRDLCALCIDDHYEDCHRMGRRA